jgi:hypothetical protein
MTADRLISRLLGAGLGVVASVAAIVSYRHMRDLSARHGEDWLSSTILPLSVDGLLAVAALVLLADARANRRSGRAPAWFAVTLGIGASVAANVAHAEPTWTGRLIGLWAPVALAVALELALRHVRHGSVSADGAPVHPDHATVVHPDPVPGGDSHPTPDDPHVPVQPCAPGDSDPAVIDTAPSTTGPDTGGRRSGRTALAGLFARVPASDERTLAELARDLAPSAGLSETTARRYLGELSRR